MFWRRRCILILCLSLLLGTCASLPNISDLKQTLNPPATPTVAGSKGPLPEKKASSLLATRMRKSGMDLKALAALEEAATGRPLIAGNKVTLLIDGPQTMKAMTQAISAARHQINLETYIFDRDELGMRFADMLIAKQRAGVPVSIVYDGVGTLGTPPEFFERMRVAGIRLLVFNPINPFAHGGQWQINNRDHRKILVVDGKVAFTGGVNISAAYANSSLFRSRSRAASRIGWRDTHLKIEGPAVAALQWLFLDAWYGQRGTDLPDNAYFPPLSEVGDKVVRVLASGPNGDYEIYKAYMLAIQEAKASIHITTAYFIPDPQVLDALTQAARRGVDVKIILPAVSDVGLVFRAGQSFYSLLLEGGVRIYQLQISVLHAKTAVIDRRWSTVGSTNIDTRSFLHNYEVNVVVLNENFGAEMETAFQEDLRGSREITKEEWEQRPFPDRVKEWAARTLEYWL